MPQVFIAKQLDPANALCGWELKYNSQRLQCYSLSGRDQFRVFTETNWNIFVVFSDSGLLRRDKSTLSTCVLVLRASFWLNGVACTFLEQRIFSIVFLILLMNNHSSSRIKEKCSSPWAGTHIPAVGREMAHLIPRSPMAVLHPQLSDTQHCVQVLPSSSVGGTLMLCNSGGKLHRTRANTQGVYKSLSPRVHNIHGKWRHYERVMWKANSCDFFANLFFSLPPAADRWLGVLPRIRRLLLLLHRWAGTSRSATPGGTPQLLVLWEHQQRISASRASCPRCGMLSCHPQSLQDTHLWMVTRGELKDAELNRCSVCKVSGKRTSPDPEVS